MSRETKYSTNAYTAISCDFPLCKSKAKACVRCDRDACGIHGRHDPRDDSDYPSWYCKPCWEIGEPFRAAITESQNLIDRLDEDWTKACIAARDAEKEAES